MNVFLLFSGNWYPSYTTSSFPILSPFQSHKLSWSSIKRLLRDDAGNCTNKLPENVSKILKKIVSDVEELREMYSPSNDEAVNTKVFPLDEQYTADTNVKTKLQENTTEFNLSLDITTIPVLINSETLINNDVYPKINIESAGPIDEKLAVAINNVPSASSLLIPTMNTSTVVATDITTTSTPSLTMSTTTRNTNCNAAAEELLKGLSKIVNCLKSLTNNMIDEENQMNNIPNTSPMVISTDKIITNTGITLSIPKANIKRSLTTGQNASSCNPILESTSTPSTTENCTSTTVQQSTSNVNGGKFVPTLSVHSTGFGFDETNCLNLNMSSLKVPNDGSSLSEMAKSMNTMVANIKAIVSSRGLRNKREGTNY